MYRKLKPERSGNGVTEAVGLALDNDVVQGRKQGTVHDTHLRESPAELLGVVLLRYGVAFLEPFDDCLSTGVNKKVVQKLVAVVHDINHQHLHFVVTKTP